LSIRAILPKWGSLGKRSILQKMQVAAQVRKAFSFALIREQRTEYTGID
jgi:hypothetical protein